MPPASKSTAKKPTKHHEQHAVREPGKNKCAAPPAPKGNLRSVKHGAKTEALVAPRRAQHIAVLKQDYPHLDDRRLALMADRLARIDLATAWIEKQRSLVYSKQGDVFQVVQLVEKWSQRAEQVLKEAELEAKQQGSKHIDLAREMAALDEGEAA